MAWHWSGIINREQLRDHGPERLRANALDILESGIRAADPYKATLDLIHREGDHLSVGPLRFDLREKEHIYILGAGKATQPIAIALEKILGDRITEGIVVLKRGEEHLLRNIQILEASHPVPDETSLKGGQEILRIAHQAGERDLLFSVITGGSSALTILPANDINLEDKQALNQILLSCGASIREINAVRKHVSYIKGGLLGLKVFPAELINLTVSDVIGDPLDYITDLTVPDTSTYLDAWNTMTKYDLWDRIPDTIYKRLKRGPEIETPKSFRGNFHSFITVTNDSACMSAKAKSEQLGYNTHLFPSKIEGESREEAISFVSTSNRIAEIESNELPLAFIAGGETVVTLERDLKGGGPNQEFALSAALEIAGCEGVVLGAIGTDGTDGPTGASGGLVDGLTSDRASSMGLDPDNYLQKHLSGSLLEEAGDLVITGPTGTNVNDLILMLMTRPRIVDQL